MERAKIRQNLIGQRRRWIVDRHRLSGFTLGTLAALPFIETLLYDIHVGGGTMRLTTIDYLELLPVVLLLWLLMVASFVIETDSARVALGAFHKKLREEHFPKLRERAMEFVFATLIIIGLFVLGGAKIARLFLELRLLELPFWSLLQFVLVVIGIWFFGMILKSAGSHQENLREALDNWLFCLKVSILFYAVLTLETILHVRLDGIRAEGRLAFRLALVKDYLLLSMISSMLYLGLFRLASARRLAVVFQSIKGLIQFIILCGIIAIMAIWADFNSTSPDRQKIFFSEEWQMTYNVVHVYLRDILLLLVPIAGLLLWTLIRVGDELKQSRDGCAPTKVKTRMRRK